MRKGWKSFEVHTREKKKKKKHIAENQSLMAILMRAQKEKSTVGKKASIFLENF